MKPADDDIRKAVLARHALRREALLPPLNIEKEVQHALDVADAVIVQERYKALCATYADERQRIRDEIIKEMRADGNLTFPNGWGGKYFLHARTERIFREFLKGLASINREPLKE